MFAEILNRLREGNHTADDILKINERMIEEKPDDPRKTKQIISNLQLALGERTETTVNVRTDDGMTNAAGNIIK